MHTTDRYTLALAMLEGDRSARRVLADMLEEQGERGLAQWAREGRHDKRRTLEFAVMLLPCRPAIGLAAEFLHKSSDRRIGSSGERLANTIHQWARKRMGDIEALETCRRDTADWLYEVRNLPAFWELDRLFVITCSQLLLGAVQLAIESENLAASGDGTRAAARVLESCHNVRKIVRQTEGLSRPMSGNGALRYLSGVPWQTEQLQHLLKELLASENDLWPR